MNVMNSSNDDVVECPLCMEPLEVDDLNFYPCTCGYQICRFCWHRIRTDENELCPACRKAYPENPADFTPLSQEQIAALKAEKRQRDQQRKQKITENRKHLANVRVVQKNLVFVVGLPPRLADADILKKYEYFGKYGKIHKVVINPSTTYAGVQGPSASAYVTYVHNNDALRAIQSVNNIMIDGRLIKTSLGTTKYCSHFMKNQQCPKGDCMYLHELGDSEASFTKEEMHQGKHQEYEKRLHDALIASSNALGNNTTPSAAVPIPNGNGPDGSDSNIHSSCSSNGSSTNGPEQGKEAWPSLSVSPVSNEKEEKSHQKTNSKNSKNNGNGGNNKENNKKHDKAKGDKKSQKNQKSNNNNNNNHNNNNNNNHNSSSKDIKDGGGLKESNTTNIQIISEHQQQICNGKDHHKAEKLNSKESHKNRVNSLDDEISFIDQLEKADSVSSEENIKAVNGNSTGGRSLSSSSSTSSASSSVSTTSVSSSSSSSNSDSVGSISETASGKSSPGSFPEHVSTTTLQQQQQQQILVSDIHLENNSSSSNTQDKLTSENLLNQTNGFVSTAEKNNKQQIQTNDTNNHIDNSVCLSKLSLFDDNNSFFSSSSFQPLLKGKLDNESRTLMNNHLNSAISSHLPDLLNGIDNYPNHTNNPLNGSNESQLGGLGEDWEAAFKYVLMRNNKQMEEQQPQQQHHHQHHPHHQEEFLRMQEMQKRNNLLNSIGMNQMNGLRDFGNTDFGGSDLSRLSQQALFHQQQQQRQVINLQNNDMLTNSLFGTTNMSKFFDFHKTQQQQQHQQHQFMMNGVNNGFMNEQHRDHLNVSNMLDNNRLGSQILDHTNGLAGPQLQKQRFNGNTNNSNPTNKYDPMNNHSNHMMLMNNQSNSQPPQQNRIPNQFSQTSTVDDDLGFDPFIETQKALAELMENENQANNVNANNSSHSNSSKQQNIIDSCQRTRMPPPGFNHMNHMNAFGFGVPRAQGSKILPFMNMNAGGNANTPNNNTVGLGSAQNGANGMPNNMQQQQQQQQQQPQHQQQQQPQNNWPQHLGFQQNPAQMNEQQLQQHLQNGGNNLNNKPGYGNVPDWTAIDPAILSFRQFPFSSQQQQQPHQQQPQHNTDMFMQHLNQQNLQQSNQEFNNFPFLGFGHHGVNNLLNPQQNSQNPMNFSSHSNNWLNNDQSLFMNSLSNGYTNNTNNYDKFSIPMPPGIHSNNMNCMAGNKQQKAECIN